MSSLDKNILNFCKQLISYDDKNNTLFYSIGKCSLKELIDYKFENKI